MMKCLLSDEKAVAWKWRYCPSLYRQRQPRNPNASDITKKKMNKWQWALESLPAVYPVAFRKKANQKLPQYFS